MQNKKSIKYKIKQALRIDRALRIVWQSTPGWTIISLTLMIVQGLLPLLSLYLMKLIIDSVTQGLTAVDKTGAFGQVLLLIGCAGAVSLINSLCNSLAE